MNPSKSDPYSPCRSFLFVINDPDTMDLTPILQTRPTIRYCIWQLEKGSKGTSQIQAYVELTKSERKYAISRLFPTAKIEKRFGTRDEAREYCRKPDVRINGPWEYGIWITGRGLRTDLDLLEQWLRQRKTESEIRDLSFRIWRANIPVIRRYKAVPPSSDNPEYPALTEDPSIELSSSNTRTLTEQGICWDHYSNRQIVIMDDFKIDISLQELLQLCIDPNKHIHINGGFATFLASQILITSNTKLDHCSGLEPEIDQKSLERHVSTRHIFEVVAPDVIRLTTKKYNLHHPQHPVVQESQTFLPLPDILAQLDNQPLKASQTVLG